MKTFIFLVGVKYEEVMKQRPHHMADYLATKGYKVLYIGTDSKKIVFEEDEFQRLFLDKEEMEFYTEIKTNLFTLPFIEKMENGIRVGMDEFLYKLESYYGSNNTIFYVGHPVWMRHLDKLTQNTKIIYDCMDDWEQFVLDLGFGEKKQIYDERKLAGVSDLIVTSARKLYCRMYSHNKNIYYMPNGVKSQDYTLSTYIPDDIKVIKGPIIFFMGTITGWVDLKLIDYIAEKRPEYSFVYVGNIVEVKKEDVPRRDNIYYLGKKKYIELVNYLKQARVAIIPFKENKLTASVSPLKFYEYISAGIPVVSTMLPDLLGIQGASIANTPTEFLNKIDNYVKMTDKEYKKLQHELIKTSTQFEWGYMLDKLIEYLENDIDGEKSKINFIYNTIEYYTDFSDNNIIKNELITMYNLIERYEEAVKIGKEIKNNMLNLDLEQLALANFKTGRKKEAIDYLRLLIDTNEHYNFYLKYIDNILKHKKSTQLLEIFLLKICYRTYEAIDLCQSIVSDESIDPVIYEMLSSLYFEIGEYDMSSELALHVLAHINESQIKEIFNPNHLINLIDYYVDEKAYYIAEELGLILFQTGLEDVATKKLGEIYFSQHFCNDIII